MLKEEKRKIRLQLFNDGDSGAGADNTGGNDGGDGQQQDTGGNNASNGDNGNSDQGTNTDQNTGGNNADNTKQEPFAVFPDEASFMGRVRREANKQQKELLKSMGLEDADQLKNIVDTHKQSIEDSKTDLEKAQQQTQNLQQERDQALQRINDMVKTTEARNIANELGVNPNRIDHFLRLADLGEIEVKDGALDRGLLKSTLGDTLKELPEFKIQQTNQGGSDFGAGNDDNKDILTMDKIKNMSTNEMSERIDEINEFMAKQNK